MRLTDQLRKGSHYLDTTWYGASVQLVATLTILFSTWEQRDTIKPEEIEMVKKDMEQCKVIMGDLGSILGTLIFFILRQITTANLLIRGS